MELILYSTSALLRHTTGDQLRRNTQHAKDREDGLSQWLNALTERKHVNVATVALANKTARIAWAIVHNETHYDPLLSAGRKAG